MNIRRLPNTRVRIPQKLRARITSVITFVRATKAREAILSTNTRDLRL